MHTHTPTARAQSCLSEDYLARSSKAPPLTPQLCLPAAGMDCLFDCFRVSKKKTSLMIVDICWSSPCELSWSLSLWQPSPYSVQTQTELKSRLSWELGIFWLWICELQTTYALFVALSNLCIAHFSLDYIFHLVSSQVTKHTQISPTTWSIGQRSLWRGSL